MPSDGRPYRSAFLRAYFRTAQPRRLKMFLPEIFPRQQAEPCSVDCIGGRPADPALIEKIIAWLLAGMRERPTTISLYDE